MWKKEYQNRAPHSCVAMDMRFPAIGVDDPEKVLHTLTKVITGFNI